MSHRGKPVTRNIREQRQREAATRQAEYDALTLQQKLDKLPPPPHAAKERARLLGAKAKPAKANKEMLDTVDTAIGHGDPLDLERSAADLNEVKEKIKVGLWSADNEPTSSSKEVRERLIKKLKKS